MNRILPNSALSVSFTVIFRPRRISANFHFNLSCMGSCLSPSARDMSMSTSHSLSPAKITEIELTRREAQLRDLLLDVARYIDESKEIKERVELRFAGGWVRDKLLGIPSNDIDTVINVMTGCSFSIKLKQFLEKAKNLQRHGLSASDIGNVHKIAANPEKSKHLETVTTKLLGYDVDFVNLRKETYSEDSRNPQMEFGTPQEDALRRDATVNALFYNLHTNQVEDFAGGLEDLQSKLIRTPLDPYQTFMDDPLRVLRLIRFASRLEFRIHEDCEACMKNDAVRMALRLKISRERVGMEVEKMLKGRNPRNSLEMIDNISLYSTIFTDPTIEEAPEPLTGHWKLSYDCLEAMRSNESPGSIYKLLIGSDDSAQLAWILSALSPWAEIPLPKPRTTGGKSPLPFATLVAREGIKLNNRGCDIVTGAFRNFKEISRFRKAVNNRENWISERDLLGMAIRRWDANGGHWKLQALLAILVEAMRTKLPGGYSALFSNWQQFLDYLQEMEVLDAPSRKRLIDGTQLAKALKIKPGRWMGAALDVCMAWQFRNPGATDPAGAVEEVRSRSKELNIPLEEL